MILAQSSWISPARLSEMCSDFNIQESPVSDNSGNEAKKTLRNIQAKLESIQL